MYYIDPHRGILGSALIVGYLSSNSAANAIPTDVWHVCPERESCVSFLCVIGYTALSVSKYAGILKSGTEFDTGHDSRDVTDTLCAREAK